MVCVLEMRQGHGSTPLAHPPSLPAMRASGHRWLWLLFVLVVGAARAATCLVYVGTYTDWELFGPPRRNPPGARSQGIYVFRFDLERGELTPLGVAAETDNPTYVTFAPSGKVLYATNEIYRFEGNDTGTVSAFAIDAATGRLTLLN